MAPLTDISGTTAVEARLEDLERQVARLAAQIEAGDRRLDEIDQLAAEVSSLAEDNEAAGAIRRRLADPDGTAR